MRRINTSAAALVVAVVALFVALGGTAYAVSQIGTSQIKNSAVTASKLHKGAVTSSKIASNAVTSSKIAANAVTTSQIANAAVTASQVAPNTFLSVTGTAANSARLGGLLPADFLQGVGAMADRRLGVAPGGSEELTSVGFGTFTGNCSAGGASSVTWTPSVNDAEYMAQDVVYTSPTSASTSFDELNGIHAGSSATEPSTLTISPVAITYQIGYTDSQSLDHVVTMYLTARYESSTGCVFLLQGLTTG